MSSSDINLYHLEWISTRSPHCKVAALSFLTIIFGNESLSPAHFTQEGGSKLHLPARVFLEFFYKEGSSLLPQWLSHLFLSLWIHVFVFILWVIREPNFHKTQPSPPGSGTSKAKSRDWKIHWLQHPRLCPRMMHWLVENSSPACSRHFLAGRPVHSCSCYYRVPGAGWPARLQAFNACASLTQGVRLSCHLCFTGSLNSNQVSFLSSSYWEMEDCI